MTSSNQNRLLSYIGSGILAIFASWLLSGCYFGNRTIGGGSIGTNYYETSFESAQFCTVDDAGNICKPGTNANQIDTATGSFPNQPNAVGYIPDPIEIYQPDPAQSFAYFFSPGGNPDAGLSGQINGSSVSAAGSNSAPQLFYWADSGCGSTMEITLNGDVTQGQYNTGTSLPLSGRLGLQVTITYTFSSDCLTGTAFQQAALCYDDVPPHYAACNGNGDADNTNRWQSVDAVFGVWRDLGVLQPTDIPSTTLLQINAQYN